VKDRRAAVINQVRTVQRSARWECCRALAPRYLLVITTLVLSLAGLRDLFLERSSAGTSMPSVQIDRAGEEFAQRFARAYLTSDPTRPTERERALNSLVPRDLSIAETPLSSRHQRVEWTEVAQNQEAIAGGRVIVVAAGVSSQTEPIYLAVPVIRVENGAIGLAGYPSLVGAPTTWRGPLAERDEVDDRAIIAVASRVVSNYLAGDKQDLAADLAPAAHVSLSTRVLTVRSVDDVTWADGVGSTAVLVTVAARDRQRFSWELTYEVGIEQTGGRPFVTFIEVVPNSP
jgi:hypothetical protein